MEYKMVIAVRNDLSPGKTAVQVAHAAVSCALEAKKRKRRWFREWQREGGRKVVVKISNVKSFFELKEKAERLGIISTIVTDAGLTEVPPGTKTAIGIGPAPSNLIDQITAQLPLL